MDGGTGRVPRIVVGVDGSPASEEALRWAVRHAALVGGTVDAVIAWEYPASYGWPAPILEGFDFEDNARRCLAGAVTAVTGGTPDGDAPIRQLVVQGHPAAALLDASEEADVLVVGNRGHGGFTEALLGSVGQHCVHHGRCPVVVVRAARNEEAVKER
ncbi:universal stress protein [Kitasatospora sp. DSM 101779]|uniref:universal stress protein n=1 Tax=Kitasatospora sp. DSM 101779 TaxID=2853165 RepID=UPI0021D85283|nr:universal stress protein [Kitasatospora sp. DSM 101779]MCU7826435.1 universal stress protein [Kitasatospora sp. DSM 101779]